MKIERLPTPRCLVGEGAVWDERRAALFFIDIIGQKIFRYTPESGEVQSWSTNGHVGALALREGGGAMLGMKNSVFTFDFATSEMTKIAGPAWERPDITINDGCADGAGRLLFGGCAAGMDAPEPIGGLFSAADGIIAQLDGGTRQSNGHSITPDGRTLYCADSFTRDVFAYDYDAATGAVANKRLFANTEALGGRPDGSQVDADGRLWMAIFEGARVAVFRPDGIVEHVVELPVRLPSSVAFGGPDLDQLYVTSLDPTAMGWPTDENGGFTFVVDGLGLRGAVAHRAA